MGPEQLKAMLETMIIPQLQSMSDEDFVAVRGQAIEVLYNESERRGLLPHLHAELDDVVD